MVYRIPTFVVTSAFEFLHLIGMDRDREVSIPKGRSLTRID